jgi:hypothetical protein
MKVGVFGSKDWTNYSDLMRNMTVFIQEAHELGHDNILLVHTGLKGAENMITEYVGKTEKFLKQKDFKLKEELHRGQSPIINDMAVVESGLEYSIVFSTGCARTKSSMKVLKEYGIPYRLIENA